MKGFKCARCGKCCYPPRISTKDIERIKKWGYREEDFVLKLRRFRYIKENPKTGYRMFLRYNGNKASCLIYKVRPKICRLYPKNGKECKPKELRFDKYLKV